MPHRKKILLSDSNEALSMLLADSLRERGNFHVFHAKDEDETTKASPPPLKNKAMRAMRIMV